MGDRTDAADSRREKRHEFGTSTLAEFLEAPEFGNFEISIFHFARVVEEYGDVAVSLKSRDWVYVYFFHFFITFLLKIEAGKEYM